MYCWQEYKVVQSLWKTVWQFLIKLHTLLKPSHPTPWYLPKRNKYTSVCPHKHMTQMFKATLFIITPNFKFSKTPINCRMDKQSVVIHIAEFYSAAKGSKLSINATVCMTLKQHYAKRNKLHSKGYTFWSHLYEVLEMTEL